MSIKIFVAIILTTGFFTSSVNSQVTAAKNEVQQAYFAEKVIMTEFAHGLSTLVRREREKCLFGCRGGDSALEISIGLLGTNNNNMAKDILINLLALRLDAGGGEGRSCQIIIRGNGLYRRLTRLNIKQAKEHCESTFKELRKRELAEVTDVTVEQVCRSETEIRSARDELLEAIKLGPLCE
jgi:hypothetical protein